MKPDDKAADLAADMRSTGLNHLAFDVGPAIEAEGLDGMKGFLSGLNRQVSNSFVATETKFPAASASTLKNPSPRRRRLRFACVFFVGKT